MASPAAVMMGNPVSNSNNTDRSISRRKKKKKVLNSVRDRHDQATAAAGGGGGTTQWKSDSQQQVYSSKLLQALRQVRINNNTTTAAASPKRGRAVREAADRVLAVAAKGRTRWSRAILTNRIKLKFMKKANRMVTRQSRTTTTMVTTTYGGRWQKKRRVSILRLKTKSLPAFQRKARVLGRLVPGCRKQPLPVILEEATDYIAALEMQVRAMTTLTELLAGASSSSSSSSSSSNQLGSRRLPSSS